METGPAVAFASGIPLEVVKLALDPMIAGSLTLDEIDTGFDCANAGKSPRAFVIR